MTKEDTASDDFESGPVIILSGPPGSGKTTVGRLLAETSKQPSVHLLTDSFYTAIKQGFIQPFLPEAARQNEVVIRVIVESMLGYARGGYEVIVDGIIGPWSIQSFVETAQRTRLDLSFVVLRPSLEQTFARAVGREGNALKAPGPIKGLYGAFEHLGALEKYVVDSTDYNAEATAVEVRRGLDARLFTLSRAEKNSGNGLGS